MEELRLFQRIRNIKRNIRIAAPATPPTTPPTTVEVEGDEFEPSPLPAAAVPVDVSPDPVPVPAPPPLMPSVEVAVGDDAVTEEKTTEVDETDEVDDSSEIVLEDRRFMKTELDEEPERVEEDDDELEKLGVKLVALDTGITSQLVSRLSLIPLTASNFDLHEVELARIEAKVVGIEEIGVAAEAVSMF